MLWCILVLWDSQGRCCCFDALEQRSVLPDVMCSELSYHHASGPSELGVPETMMVLWCVLYYYTCLCTKASEAFRGLSGKLAGRLFRARWGNTRACRAIRAGKAKRSEG